MLVIKVVKLMCIKSQNRIVGPGDITIYANDHCTKIYCNTYDSRKSYSYSVQNKLFCGVISNITIIHAV